MLYMFVFSLLVDVLCCTPVSVLMNCQFQFQKKKKKKKEGTNYCVDWVTIWDLGLKI